MSVPKRIKLSFGDVFPYGAYLVGDVSAVADYMAQPMNGVRPQKVDVDSGLLVWSIDVIDADPATRQRNRLTKVKLLSKVQPVPPAKGSLPFASVDLGEITATPYVDEKTKRLAWSLMASKLDAVGSSSKPIDKVA